MYTSFWSLPMRGVWIEMLPGNGKRLAGESLPMRGVWIEISTLWSI